MSSQISVPSAYSSSGFDVDIGLNKGDQMAQSFASWTLQTENINQQIPSIVFPQSAPATTNGAYPQLPPLPPLPKPNQFGLGYTDGPLPGQMNVGNTLYNDATLGVDTLNALTADKLQDTSRKSATPSGRPIHSHPSDAQRQYVLKRAGSANSTLRRQISNRVFHHNRAKPATVYPPLLPKSSDATGAPSPSPNSLNNFFPRSYSDMPVTNVASSNDSSQLLAVPSIQAPPPTFSTNQEIQNVPPSQIFDIQMGYPVNLFSGIFSHTGEGSAFLT
ncbi:hypothetical protein HDU96_002440 [Phlyctochytrium bullatum]|nr:hypothetical protein HDU96_002440 [Phlyctochytrium bullatum]